MYAVLDPTPVLGMHTAADEIRGIDFLKSLTLSFKPRLSAEV